MRPGSLLGDSYRIDTRKPGHREFRTVLGDVLQILGVLIFVHWAKRLKRIFQIDVETCPSCGGTVQIIACIEDPPVIERILTHLAGKNLPGLWAESRKNQRRTRTPTIMSRQLA